MIALLVAATLSTAAVAYTSADDQQLVALTVTTISSCLRLDAQSFTIYKGYAVGVWQCGRNSGGMIAAIKWDGRWIPLTSGGGMMDVGVLEGQNVPTAIAKVLLAPCPPGRSHPLSGPHVTAGATVCTP